MESGSAGLERAAEGDSHTSDLTDEIEDGNQIVFADVTKSFCDTKALCDEEMRLQLGQ